MRTIDPFGKLFITFTWLLSGFMLYRIYLDYGENTAEFLAATGVWLIASLLVIALATGIARGENRTEIKIPKTITIIVLTSSTILFATALYLQPLT